MQISCKNCFLNRKVLLIYITSGWTNNIDTKSSRYKKLQVFTQSLYRTMSNYCYTFLHLEFIFKLTYTRCLFYHFLAIFVYLLFVSLSQFHHNISSVSLTRCTSMKCEFQTTDGTPEQFVP